MVRREEKEEDSCYESGVALLPPRSLGVLAVGAQPGNLRRRIKDRSTVIPESEEEEGFAVGRQGWTDAH